MTHQLEVFKSPDGKFYWRRTDENGTIVEHSEDGYRRRVDAVDEAEQVNPDIKKNLFILPNDPPEPTDA